MSSASYEAEGLREEALRFVSGLVHRNPAVAADQLEALWYGFPDDDEDYKQLLEAVELRFLNRPDGAGDTQARFMELVRSYSDLHRSRSRLHADVCILLIGHAHLFNRFENLRFMNDGRVETRLQIMDWRNSVGDEIMAAIGVVLAEYSSAITRLKWVTLERRDLDFIARTCGLPAVVDPNSFMMNLVRNPDSVLPTLERNYARFRRLDRFLEHYFDQVASGGI